MSDERFDPKEQPAELPPRKWPDHRERLPPPVIPSRELAEKVEELLETFDDVVPGGPPPKRKRAPIAQTGDDAEDWNRGEQ